MAAKKGGKRATKKRIPYTTTFESKQKRGAGPGRHPQHAYARIVVAMTSMKDPKLPPQSIQVLMRLPDAHRIGEVSLSVMTVDTLVPKG